MAQFDVFSNPFAQLRHAYPFVVLMQSDMVSDLRDQLVAPLVPRAAFTAVPGKLLPIAPVGGREHVVLVPRLTLMRTKDLGRSVDSIAVARSQLLAAIDYLFFGI